MTTQRIYAEHLYPLTENELPLRGYVDFAEDGTILGTGAAETVPEGAVYYDGAVVPGLVNAHCHIELSHLEGRFRRGTGMAGFIDQINALRDSVSREAKVEAIRRWMDRLWEQGVSAMADISNGADSLAVKAASPLYTRSFLEVFGTSPAECDAIMASVRALQREAERFGLDAAPTPHAPYTMSPQLLSAASGDALRAGYLSYHCEESSEEDEMIRFGRGAMWDNRRRAGMPTPPVTGQSSLRYFIERLRAAGEPPYEAHILLVHEVCLDEDGVASVKAVMRHPFFAVCPLSNIFIHNALPPIGLMRKSGIPICIGTDSLSSNDTLDMVRELYCLQENFPALSLGEMLGWACRNGAAMLGKEAVYGSLAPGKRPGLVFIDHLTPDGRLTSASVSRRIL